MTHPQSCFRILQTFYIKEVNGMLEENTNSSKISIPYKKFPKE
jgi:hypothetical protein